MGDTQPCHFSGQLLSAVGGFLANEHPTSTALFAQSLFLAISLLTSGIFYEMNILLYNIP
jgi:hypothetical protein